MHKYLKNKLITFKRTFLLWNSYRFTGSHKKMVQRSPLDPSPRFSLGSLPAWLLSAIRVCVHAQSLSCVQFFVTPQTVTHQASLSMGFSRQDIGVGGHFLLQGSFPTQGLNLGLLHLLHCRWILSFISLLKYSLLIQSFPGNQCNIMSLEDCLTSPSFTLCLEFIHIWFSHLFIVISSN